MKYPAKGGLQRVNVAIDDVFLAKGKHPPALRAGDPGSVMEWASHFAGETWSAEPACVSPTIAAFLRSWNDWLPDEERQRLRDYIHPVLQTNTGKEDERIRSWLATDWLVRIYAPRWLELSGLPEEAEKLRSLPEINSDEVAQAVKGSLDTAVLPAVSGERATASEVAESAQKVAAGASGGLAADVAARAGMSWSERSPAGVAIRTSASWAAMWAARWAITSAVGVAPAATLRPTVVKLQDEADQLLRSMISVSQSQ
jgi:hypothetical protein